MRTLTAIPSAGDRPRTETDAELRCGRRLGRYELLRRIATGGMAQVWVARQRGDFGFARTVAIKVIRPEHAGNATFRRMFLDEARLSARISHPNVVHVLDLGEQDDVVFLAMELVEGTTLAQLLRRAGGQGHDRELAPLPPGIVARVVADMAAGLHAAHELADDSGTPLHLVHRDVSPQNILLSLGGVTKIADFGIAKASGRLTEETEAGQLKGKWSYLSPEQLTRQPLDRRSDVFSTGIVLWEALTGERLFRGEDALDTAERVKGAPIRDPRAVAPGVPMELAKVVLKALERDPAHRFSTAAELSDAVEEAARKAHVLATGKQVGEFVSACALGEVSERRAAIAEAATALDATADVRVAEAVRPPRRRAIVWGLGAATIALCVWGVGAAAVGKVRTGSAVAAANVAAPAADDVPVADLPAPLPSTAEPSPSASASSRPARSATPSSTTRAAAHPRAAAPGASQKIPFTNPYQQ